MKTILCMAMTLNGKIAKTDGDSEFTSPDDNAFFRSMCKKTGNAIIGKKTYDYIRSKDCQQNDILTVVLTHNADLPAKSSSHTIFTDKSPSDVLKLLEEMGYSEALVCGGGILNSSFLEVGLIDEIYIDIEPIVLGRGIPLFAESDFDEKLHLLSITKLNRHTIQLHYRVIQ